MLPKWKRNNIMKDYNKAFEWYLKSAINECSEGQNNLGNYYYYEIG